MSRTSTRLLDRFRVAVIFINLVRSVKSAWILLEHFTTISGTWRFLYLLPVPFHLVVWKCARNFQILAPKAPDLQPVKIGKIKGIDESLSRVDSSVPLIYHSTMMRVGDLGSLILIEIIQNKLACCLMQISPCEQTYSRVKQEPQKPDDRSRKCYRHGLLPYP